MIWSQISAGSGGRFNAGSGRSNATGAGNDRISGFLREDNLNGQERAGILNDVKQMVPKGDKTDSHVGEPCQFIGSERGGVSFNIAIRFDKNSLNSAPLSENCTLYHAIPSNIESLVPFRMHWPRALSE